MSLKLQFSACWQTFLVVVFGALGLGSLGAGAQRDEPRKSETEFKHHHWHCGGSAALQSSSESCWQWQQCHGPIAKKHGTHPETHTDVDQNYLQVSKIPTPLSQEKKLKICNHLEQNVSLFWSTSFTFFLKFALFNVFSWRGRGGVSVFWSTPVLAFSKKKRFSLGTPYFYDFFQLF
jgi:hypothetical protein